MVEQQRTEERRVPQGFSFVRSYAWWLCVCALGIYELSITLLNSAVYPLFSGVFLEARDIGTLMTALCSIVLYVFAVRHPEWMKQRLFAIVSLVSVVVGSVGIVICAYAGDPVLLTLIACVRSIGMAWIGCIVYLPLVSLTGKGGTRSVLAALCAGWAICYALELAFSYTPDIVQYIAFFICPFVTVVCSYRGSNEVIEHARIAIPTSDLRVTNPRSFLPLGHTVFIMLILLKMSFGFAITFASNDATPLNTVLACVPALLIACILMLTTRPGHGLNGFYRATLLCVLAGFLLVNPLINELIGIPALANVVLRAGSDLTRMFAFLLVAYLGARNLTYALGLSLYVSAANSLGSVAGAQLGIAANALLISNEGLFALLLAAFVFALVAYNVLAPHGFDFDKAAQGIEAITEPQPTIATDMLTMATAQVARDYGLTPREAEALELLAHGRNTQAIQDRLVISRSTAKTHIRNIYAKLDVHSQQDLIDVVEQAAAQSA